MKSKGKLINDRNNFNNINIVGQNDNRKIKYFKLTNYSNTFGG